MPAFIKPPSLPTHYPALLANIKRRIRQAQTRAVLAVNAELIRLYWEIGQMLDARPHHWSNSLPAEK